MCWDCWHVSLKNMFSVKIIFICQGVTTAQERSASEVASWLVASVTLEYELKANMWPMYF